MPLTTEIIRGLEVIIIGFNKNFFTLSGFEKIAKALGVPVSTFFKDEESKAKYEKSEEEDFLKELSIDDRDLFEGVVKEFKDLTDKDKENIREVIRLARK